MKKGRFTWLLALPLGLSLAACTASPTAPSFDGAHQTAPTSAVLRWDMVAPGCRPSAAPSPLPDTSTAKINRPTPTSLNATWNWTSPSQRSVVLYAQFHDVKGEWALCSWDTADV